eukprot:TRINITY_DN108796_c0_g1_i1.p1 TRINITY_DN108796_c0_g1~~TRINITY_DN108796_c0_g1_i1.p1  ORF type:complete len:341 (+),score=82.26 TRINITY_DN108796_c0_g1_i1:90-1025(+)
MATDEEAEQPLSEQLANLSNLGRVVDGSGFAFRSLSCVGKRIGAIKIIEGYVHLQHIDLSENMIKDVAPLKGLQFAVSLNLAKNSIANLKGWESEEPVFPNLQALDLSDNQLSALTPLAAKALISVNLARNEIATCAEFGGHETLQKIDLSENKLPTLAGVSGLPALKTLNVASNELVDINGLADLPALEDLNLASNKFQALEGPWQDLQNLRSLNLSGNLMEAAKPMEVLRQLPLLRTLAVKGNPFLETAEVSASVVALGCHWRLTSVDGVDVKEEDLEKAKERNVERILEERQRAKEEAEAAAAAAAEE